MYVQTGPLSAAAQQLTFGQIANEYVAQLAQSYTNYKQLAAYSTSIDGMPAVLVTYSSTENQTAITTDTLFMVKYGISYTVNGESLTSAWPQHRGEIEHSLLSFRP